MTVEEVATILKARRNGSGWVAKCPIHKERTGSVSIRSGPKSVLLYCFGCHARSSAIMQAIGLKGSDAFYDSGTKMTPAQRDAYRREKGRQEQAELQRKQWIVAVVSHIAYPNEAQYWGVVAEARLRAWQHTEQRHRSPEQRDNDRAQFVADVLREAERKLEILEIGSLAWHQQLSTARRWCEEFNRGFKQRSEVYL